MKKLFNIIPKYTYIPLFLAILTNTLVYNVSKIFTNSLKHYDLSIFIDNYIPFISIFIVIYVLSYIQWLIGYIVIAKGNKEKYFKVIIGDIIAKLICLMFFIILPSYIIRPEIINTDIFNSLTNFIYKMDEPVNLFPSIHCLESYIVFRGCLNLKVPKSYKISMGIFTVLVCLSTVFVKQHVFIDIIGGILVAEIGLQIGKKINLFKVKQEV